LRQCTNKLIHDSYQLLYMFFVVFCLIISQKDLQVCEITECVLGTLQTSSGPAGTCISKLDLNPICKDRILGVSDSSVCKLFVFLSISSVAVSIGVRMIY
jgi:hypothetical protein